MENRLPQNIDEYLEVFKKRKKSFFIPFLVVLILAGVAYPFIPRMYQARASIMFLDDKITPLVKQGKPESNGPEKRLRALYAQMMTLENQKFLAEKMGRENILDDPRKLRRLVKKTQKNVEVTVAPGGVVELMYRASDPVSAQRGADAVAETIVELERRTAQDEASKTIRFIEDQLRIYKGKIEDSEKSFFVSRVGTDLNAALKRRSLLLDQVYDLERRSPATRQDDPAVYKLQSELAEVRARLSQMSVTAREESPMIQELRRKMNELEAALSTAKERSVPVDTAGSSANPDYLEALRQLKQVNNDIAYLRKRQKNLERGVDLASPEELGALAREQGVNEDIYQSLLRGLESAQMSLRLASFGEGVTVRLVEKAELPVLPVWPIGWQVFGGAFILAIAAGAGWVILKEYQDTSIRGVDDAQRQLRIPVLAGIPRIPDPERKRTSPVRLATFSPLVVTYHHPQSLYAEHYRLLRTRIMFMTQARPIRRLLVTSAVAGEGKTTTTANLAVSIANETDKRVLLMDCDIRQSSVAAVMGVARGRGVFDYLKGGADVDSILKPTSLERLTVVTAGEPAANPAKLLGSPRMTHLMDELSRRFDIVVMDAPPVVPLADVPMLSAHADAAIMVVQASKTPRRFIMEALSALESTARENLLGCVVTSVESKLPTYINQYFVGGLTVSKVRK